MSPPVNRTLAVVMQLMRTIHFLIGLMEGKKKPLKMAGGSFKLFSLTGEIKHLIHCGINLINMSPASFSKIQFVLHVRSVLIHLLITYHY